jgi:flagellar assembly protein FliH
MINLSRVLKCDCVIMGNSSIVYDEMTFSNRIMRNPEAQASELKMTDAAESADIIIKNALTKADEIRLQAQMEAQQIIKEASQIKKDAYAAGFENGIETGIQQGAKKAEEDEAAAVAQLQEAACRLEGCQSDIGESINSQAVDFAFYLAEKIVNMQIDKDDEAFLNICKNALSHIGETSSAVIRVGPREYEIVTHFQKELKKCLNGLDDLEVELENDRDGYCVIETSSGSVDASVNAQLNRAKQMVNIETEE